MDRKKRTELLRTAIGNRILLLDGAMGTAIQGYDLNADDFGGTELEGCNENLVLTRPDVIQEIHESYLEAGSDIIETNTFGSTPVVLAEYGLQDKTIELNRMAVELAKKAVEKYETPDRPRFICGSMGPTTKAISVTGGITFDELVENFYAQAKALFEAGVDYLLLETAQDTRNIKAGLVAIDRLFEEVGEEIPIAVSGTIEPMGTMLAGQSVESLVISLAHRKLLYIGLNCATGPEFMTDHIRSMSALAPFPIACVPNAGLPDVDGNYLETVEMVAKHLEHFVKSGWINVIGGCCGTTPDYIRALRGLADKGSARKIPTIEGSYLSGIDFLEVNDEKRPIPVGERTNVIGSRKFKRLILQEKFEEASEIGRRQVKNGAQIVDVCLANPDRDELEDITAFLDQAIQKVRVPFMIDSTDEVVIAKALTYSQGKSIINSINLEDGEERFEKVLPLAKQFGAALVVGTIDEDPEQGMGVSRQRKLAIAQRSYDLLVNKYGISPYDIYFDPLVFPCGTGDEQYKGSAVETIEGVRLIKEKLPQCKTVLGISNVSFGLPPAGREVLNAVFLHRCVEAGLDLAIVNTELLKRYSQITDEEKQLCEDLMHNRGDDPIATFADFFREKKLTPKEQGIKLPLDERLANYILEGSKDGLKEDLDEALKKSKPLAIINGPLMNGMDEVGRLFNNNELIVAEVLQSAEAMKAAVAHLEPHMDKADTSSRGKVLLATVKGDVHDIGKNLVDIILSNNAFEVINLGIKIPPEQLIKAVKEHKPDIIGLSGLLVKSAQQMVITAEDLKNAGIKVPMLVGGAALSRKFADSRISPAYTAATLYAKDAMDGLDLAKKIMSPGGLDQLLEALQKNAPVQEKVTEKETPAVSIKGRSEKIDVLSQVPPAPDFEQHILTYTPIQEIWAYINPRMLYGKHLGLKGPVLRLWEEGGLDALRQADEGKKAVDIFEAVEEIKRECGRTHFNPKAVYQFFRAASEDNDLILFDENEKEIARWGFPRQQKDAGLCLSDYAQALKNGIHDSVCLFVTSAGAGIREQAESWKESGEYLKSHIIQALALETAEGYAEWLHAKIRGLWGFADPVDMTMPERFQAKYHGKRFSFGYPACPDLADQEQLFKLLKPEGIGIELTEGYMMDPEASVSAIVFHHPQATYFSVL
jgi:5-methyltetrahydrofolate--homocysteine methyltransferase